MRKRIPAKIMALLMALTILATLAACAGESTPAADPTPGEANASSNDNSSSNDGGAQAEEPDPNKWQPPDNYGGRQFLIGDWWSPSLDAPKRKPTNLRGELLEDYIYSLEQDYGFTIARAGISGWGEYLELFTTSVMAGDPACDIFVMSQDWATMLMNQGLLYPLNTLDSVDVHADKWVKSVTDDFTDADGNVYALNNDPYIEGRNVIYWNKRLFEEAGIDRNLPYDLQASGDWTWDAFLDICRQLNRDTDGDGITDKFAFCGFAVRVFQGFLYNNDAQEIKVDAEGKYYNAMLEPNFVETMQFLQNLWDEGYWYDGPADKDPDWWNWFDEGFISGQVAMKGAEIYESSTLLEELQDEWGMVFPPKGPRADDYCIPVNGNNVFVLPFNLSKDKAEEIMYAFNLYTEPLEYDLENPEFWKDGDWGYQRFADSRAVDETMTMFFEGRYKMNSRNFVPGGEAGIDWGPVFDWGFMSNSEQSPIEKIEAAAPVIQAVLDRENAKRFP